MKKKGMTRKQFHLGSDEEKILQETAAKYGLSEAEIVREAIKEYGQKKLKRRNPLLTMAEKKFPVKINTPHDLASNHDHYLTKGDSDEEA